MRAVVAIVAALVLALPAGAAAEKRSPGDGTLVVENAQGVVWLSVRGGIIGRFDQGAITIDDPVPGDGVLIVRGYQKATSLGPNKVQYSGDGGVRFRLIGGLYRVRITAIGADVSVVGRGSATLNGGDFPDQPGRYSLNGGAWAAMPSVPTLFTLGTPPPIPPLSR